MRQRYSVLLVVLAGISCAKQQEQLAPDPGRSVVTHYHGAVTVDVHGSVDPSVHIMSAPIDSVWGALPGVYERLGIEPTLVDPRGYQIGNTRFVSRHIEGARLSRYLQCGHSIGNSDNADSYRVTMSVVTRVRVDEDRQTVLQTELSASAKPRHVSGNAVICSTTGKLEARIAELASAILRDGNQPQSFVEQRDGEGAR
jgi:hypothetical protein